MSRQETTVISQIPRPIITVRVNPVSYANDGVRQLMPGGRGSEQFAFRLHVPYRIRHPVLGRRNRPFLAATIEISEKYVSNSVHTYEKVKTTRKKMLEVKIS